MQQGALGLRARSWCCSLQVPHVASVLTDPLQAVAPRQRNLFCHCRRFLLTKAFTFPEDKKEFTAANGVTYSWNGDKWVTNPSRLTSQLLEPIVERLDEDELKQGELTERVNDGEIKQRQIELS